LQVGIAQSPSENFPALHRLLAGLLKTWPEHEKFLSRSFKDRSPELLASSDRVARMILDLEGDDLDGLCTDYRWMCARLQDEELEFRRHGRYRHTSFAEVERLVYGNGAFMAPYIRGLLLSQVAWFNHASAIDFYLREFLSSTPVEGRLLEIGPGHGLLLGLAASSGRQAAISGWDISATSIAATEATLRRLGVRQPVALAIHDISRPITAAAAFDSIVLSEVLEHLEEPEAALRHVGKILAPGGRLFVNVPVNSPAPDHIYLLRSPDEALQLLERGGFHVLEARHFPSGGYTLDRATRAAITISSALIAEHR
jgi:2-polyprenyl-3-methyl-5-hydroxy-6-metoxy-1,4-benzoquinol methylase